MLDVLRAIFQYMSIVGSVLILESILGISKTCLSFSRAGPLFKDKAFRDIVKDLFKNSCFSSVLKKN